jgi:sulfoxide reductase heme-binding subunit YedZ
VLFSNKCSNQRQLLSWRWFKLALSGAALTPFFIMVWGVFQNSLGADPARVLALETGRWSIWLLLVSLSITPLRELSRLSKLAPLRRTFGLISLFYASVHFLVYVLFLLEMRWSEIGSDILERPYITVGFAAFLILALLGATSPKSIVRRLGRKWRVIHRLVYLAIMLAIVHVTWILRTDVFDAVLYAFITVLLLGYRLNKSMRKNTTE